MAPEGIDVAQQFAEKAEKAMKEYQTASKNWQTVMELKTSEYTRGIGMVEEKKIPDHWKAAARKVKSAMYDFREMQRIVERESP